MRKCHILNVPIVTGVHLTLQQSHRPHFVVLSLPINFMHQNVQQRIRLQNNNISIKITSSQNEKPDQPSLMHKIIVHLPSIIFPVLSLPVLFRNPTFCLSIVPPMLYSMQIAPVFISLYPQGVLRMHCIVRNSRRHVGFNLRNIYQEQKRVVN